MVQRYGTSSMPRSDGVYVRHSDYEALADALRKIAAIEDKMVGGDWDEIEEARSIAREALGEQA